MSTPLTTWRVRLALVALSVLTTLGAGSNARAQFTYDPAGTLVSGSGSGRADAMVYAPDMRFPIQSAPAFANSQVWGVGGSSGPSGSQCDTRNFSYPWHDNYCETRTWDMPLCPSGTGHQGQDIRAATCMAEMHPVIAVVSGTITNVGSYSVYLTAADGTRYDYLHMRPVLVTTGQRVSAGDLVCYVANEFGGTPTTTHLHFNIRQNVSGVGSVYVPPYMSLIRAYERLLGMPGGMGGPRFAATYVHQTFPLSSMPFELAPGTVVDGYLELRNTGSETWRPGETFLGTTEPRDGASAIAGPDWLSPSRAATIDRVVAPGETGRFDFSVRAPAVPGDYDQFFDPVQEGVAWFADDGGPPDRWIELRVTVLPGMDADGDGYAPSAGDCDDTSASVHPGATETCGDGIDQDCAGGDLACDVDAAVVARPDAGASGGPSDAGSGGSAMPDASDPRTWRGDGASGCSCRVGAHRDAPLALVALTGLLALLIAQRRRTAR